VLSPVGATAHAAGAILDFAKVDHVTHTHTHACACDTGEREFTRCKGRLIPLKSPTKTRVLKSQINKFFPTCIVCSTGGHSEVDRLFGKSRPPFCDMCTQRPELVSLSFWKVMVLAGHLGQLFRSDPPEPKSPKSRQKSIFCESGTFSQGESPFRQHAVAAR